MSSAWCGLSRMATGSPTLAKAWPSSSSWFSSRPWAASTSAATAGAPGASGASFAAHVGRHRARRSPPCGDGRAGRWSIATVDRHGGAGRHRFQRVGQAGIVERAAADADRDLPVIEAEAVERRLQPADILLRPRDQREGGDRRLLPQAHQVGAAGQRLVERAVAGGRRSRRCRAAGRPRARRRLGARAPGQRQDAAKEREEAQVRRTRALNVPPASVAGLGKPSRSRETSCRSVSALGTTRRGINGPRRRMLHRTMTLCRQARGRYAAIPCRTSPGGSSRRPTARSAPRPRARRRC